MRRFCQLLIVAMALQWATYAQTSPADEKKTKPEATRPLPDIPSLFRDIVKHQKELDEIRKNYMFNEQSREEELDGNGNVKNTKVEERETFFVGRRQVSRLLRKDGRALTEDEKKKEQKRVDKEIEDFKKRELKREEQNKDDDDEIGVETFLKIAKLSNERREMRNGQEALVFDFTGDPDAKTHGTAEKVVKKVSGTIWVDESRRQLVRMEAQLDDDFKIGGGLLASVHKGSKFAFEQAFVNEEIWLPTFAEATITGKMLLFKSIRQHQVSRFSDYRKFRSKSTVTLADEPKPKEADPK